MGFFSKILDKLGLNKKDKPAPTAAAGGDLFSKTAKPAATAKSGTAPKATAAPKQYERPAVNIAPVPVSEVDVVAKLEKLSAGKGLNWKVSIVDLLKLLDIDSSLTARKELATELGCPANLMGDSAKMNVWLHKTVLKKIAENGGNIPQSLLD